jgi:endonuclease/exonuclease/phosphatase family metal-dependent hydrolase
VPYAATLGAAILAAGAIAAAATLPDTAARPAGGPFLTVIAFALGWIAFIGLAFFYYAYYTPPLAPLIATGAVLIGVIAGAPLPAPRLGIAGTILVALLSVVAPLVALVATPSAPVDASPRTAFRLMTYNVHQGFDAGDVPALDAISDTIRAETPDVVILQEVGRGWMITEQHDVLTFLAERTGMQYVFGPTIGEAYGNAVLSRLPVTDVRYISYPRQALLRHQPRGAILFRVADVLVFATHLDHIDGASEVRQGQIHTLLGAWNQERPAIVAGDLNALPGTPELRLLEDAGFRDLAKADGADQPTWPSSDPKDRIDYIWGIGVTGTQAHTVTSTASDHRPLVVTISRQR